MMENLETSSVLAVQGLGSQTIGQGPTPESGSSVASYKAHTMQASLYKRGDNSCGQGFLPMFCLIVMSPGRSAGASYTG